MTEEPIFSLKDVTCRRANRLLFQNFSLDVQRGDLLRLMGPNGAGKTSLLRIMCNMLPVQGGTIVFRKNLSTVFMPADDNALKVQETVIENLSFWQRLWGRGNPEKALGDVDLLSLKNKRVKVLSAGQKRRLSLARVSMSGADLWLLDEPLNALDSASQEKLAQMMKRHVTAGGAIVLAGHQPVEGAQEVKL